MKNGLILKIRWKSPLVGKLFQLYGDFLPQLSHSLGNEIFIEKVIDGVLIFFNGMADFVKFHQAAELISIPEVPGKMSPRSKSGNVELYVDVVRLPPKVTVCCMGCVNLSPNDAIDSKKTWKKPRFRGLGPIDAKPLPPL